MYYIRQNISQVFKYVFEIYEYYMFGYYFSQSWLYIPFYNRHGLEYFSFLGIDYPLDIWFIISEYIKPEAIGKFACICRSSYYVTTTAKFWFHLYKTYVYIEFLFLEYYVLIMIIIAVITGLFLVYQNVCSHIGWYYAMNYVFASSGHCIIPTLLRGIH